MANHLVEVDGEEDFSEYVQCYRCGITLMSIYSTSMSFCADCNHPDLIGVFRPLDYGWIFEGEE